MQHVDAQFIERKLAVNGSVYAQQESCVIER